MPVRIAGMTLPDQKRLQVALTRIYGIGRNTGLRILRKAGVDPTVKTRDLTEREVSAIRTIIEQEYITEGELRREIVNNIRRLKEIGAYRGLRHAKRLPVRGQRTRTNSRTVRGNIRKTAGSGKRGVEKK